MCLSGVVWPLHFQHTYSADAPVPLASRILFDAIIVQSSGFHQDRTDWSAVIRSPASAVNPIRSMCDTAVPHPVVNADVQSNEKCRQDPTSAHRRIQIIAFTRNHVAVRTGRRMSCRPVHQVPGRIGSSGEGGFRGGFGRPVFSWTLIVDSLVGRRQNQYPWGASPGFGSVRRPSSVCADGCSTSRDDQYRQ